LHADGRSPPLAEKMDAMTTSSAAPADGPREARSRLIAKFLKTELEGGGVAATQLEAEARAAGLLGAEQPITNAKLFRRAKKDLGICSTRVGGRNGDWYWVFAEPRRQMPRKEHERYKRPSPENAPKIKSGSEF
jgi:hypothetical protein